MRRKMADLAASWRQMTDRGDRSGTGSDMSHVPLVEENQTEEEREMVVMDHESIGRRAPTSIQDEVDEEAAAAPRHAYKKEN